MFGYVTVAKSQLSEKDYKTFCAYYCGLCRAIGRECSQLSRLGLSYDITFLAIVLSSVIGKEPETVSHRCAVHPTKKRLSVVNDMAVDYAAAMGTMLTYLKLEDDLRDEHSLKAAAGMAAMRSGYRRSCRRYQPEADMIRGQLAELSRLEKDGCDSIDETAEAFAKILENMFTPGFIEEDTLRRSLAWLGYNLGRWIYIMDAYNDMDSDMKEGSYNPLLAGGKSPEYYRGEAAREIELSLTFTLENIASAFELIDLGGNKNIIGRIIYTCLKQKQKAVLSGEAAVMDNRCLLRGTTNGSGSRLRRNEGK